MLYTAFIYMKKMPSAASLFFTLHVRFQAPTCRLCFLAGFTNDRVRFEEPAWQTVPFRGSPPMHILKLVLPLAGLLMAGQALAHKVSRAGVAALGSTHPAASRIDTDPTALLDEVSGRGVQGTSVLPGMAPVPAPAKSNAISARINRRH